MRLVVERPHSKYGSAIFTKPDLDIISTGITDKNNIEIPCLRSELIYEIPLRVSRAYIYIYYICYSRYKYNVVPFSIKSHTKNKLIQKH